jgi:DNA-binding response OmpR family regulator
MQVSTNSMSTQVSRVLIIEDDSTVATTLRYNLQKQGHHVTVATDGLDGIRSARSQNPDVVLLDLMLPNIDGREVCRYLRSRTDAPILMLTALDREEDIIAGLEAGADDYVTKPFSMKELIARINALVRRARSHVAEAETLISGDLVVMISEHRTLYRGRELRLAPKEFQILLALMRRAGKVCTRAELMKEAWGEGVIVDPRNVDVHVRLIRAQLEGEPDGSWLIQTVHGVGYRFAGELGPNPPGEVVDLERTTI